MSNCAMIGDSAASQNSAHLATRARLDRPLTRRRSSVLSTSLASIAESVPQVNTRCTETGEALPIACAPVYSLTPQARTRSRMMSAGNQMQ